VPAGGLFDERVLVVSEGFNALARPLVGVKRYEQRFDVWDRDGQVIGAVEPTFRDSAASKVFRALFALAFTTNARRNVLDYRLADRLGTKLLELEIRGEVLYVKDPVHGLVGSVSNTGGPGELEATFYAEAPATKLFQKSPPAIGMLRDKVDSPPYEYELRDTDGAVFARVSNSGDRRNVLELADGADPRLRTLAIGFACGLVDRIWLMVPRRSAGGDV
jgi:hypothetical protein